MFFTQSQHCKFLYYQQSKTRCNPQLRASHVTAFQVFSTRWQVKVLISISKPVIAKYTSTKVFLKSLILHVSTHSKASSCRALLSELTITSISKVKIQQQNLKTTDLFRLHCLGKIRLRKKKLYMLRNNVFLYSTICYATKMLRTYSNSFPLLYLPPSAIESTLSRSLSFYTNGSILLIQLLTLSTMVITEKL